MGTRSSQAREAALGPRVCRLPRREGSAEGLGGRPVNASGLQTEWVFPVAHSTRHRRVQVQPPPSWTAVETALREAGAPLCSVPRRPPGNQRGDSAPGGQRGTDSSELALTLA